MRQVLDDGLLDGIANADLRLRPARCAWTLSNTSWDDAVSAVEMLSQYWGGVADLLVPVDDLGRTSRHYERLVATSEVDSVTGVGAPWVSPTLKHRRLRRLPTLMALATAERERLKVLQSSRVDPQDPWSLTYLATLGYLPENPTPSTLEELGLNPDLTFDAVVRYEHIDVEEPSLDDLLQRAQAEKFFTPARASWHALRRSPAKVTHAASDGWRLDRAAFARQQGPAVVVVY